MRTTIDIPNDLRQKLITEAARRNLKGFSLLVTEALKDYFSTKRNNRDETIVQLKGCLSNKELEDDIRRISEGQSNWRIRYK